MAIAVVGGPHGGAGRPGQWGAGTTGPPAGEWGAGVKPGGPIPTPSGLELRHVDSCAGHVPLRVGQDPPRCQEISDCLHGADPRGGSAAWRRSAARKGAGCNPVEGMPLPLHHHRGPLERADPLRVTEAATACPAFQAGPNGCSRGRAGRNQASQARDTPDKSFRTALGFVVGFQAVGQTVAEKISADQPFDQPRGLPAPSRVPAMASIRGESGRARLCSRLDAEWRRVGASSAGRAAVRRWAEEEEPALAGAISALGVLARCQRHGDGQEALAAVLRLADTEDFARQTVIQALLPGLVALARRAHYIRGGIC
jgi:hypothetical protein